MPTQLETTILLIAIPLITILYVIYAIWHDYRHNMNDFETRDDKTRR